MTLPKLINVGPFKCTVVRTEEAIQKASLEAGVELDGQWQARSLTIVIRPDLAADLEAETLVHEVLHVLFAIAGVEDDAGEQEAIVTRLSPLLLDTLRRNPLMVRYLLERQ